MARRKICKNCGVEITHRPQCLMYLEETHSVEKVCPLCHAKYIRQRTKEKALRRGNGKRA